MPAVLCHAERESVVSICSCMSCSTWSVSVHGRAVEDKVRSCCAIVISNARNNVTSSLLSAPTCHCLGRLRTQMAYACKPFGFMSKPDPALPWAQEEHRPAPLRPRRLTYGKCKDMATPPKHHKAEEEQHGEKDASVRLALATSLQASATLAISGSNCVHSTASGLCAWLLPLCPTCRALAACRRTGLRCFALTSLRHRAAAALSPRLCSVAHCIGGRSDEP